MKDPKEIIGRELPAFTTLAERGRLRFFAQVLGEEDPVYRDLDAARAAGHPDLPLPPTFLFSLELERPDPYGVLDELGVDMRQILHGEEEFTYHRVACAGQELYFAPRITDYYEKKGGALKFLVRTTTVTHQGALVAELTNTCVIRRLELT
ncbi:MaoC family dehydratase N-terminal domain-containing protein [Streptomyces sp. NBC_00656]|uniref:MaoC family dehydratase N-terminal domain-containing protein n=1 Tax=Streptomyces sp. NBC_00656 TaxID=2903668 RepID=UPI0032553012